MFAAIDKKLQDIACRLVFFIIGDDAYHFTVLRYDDFLIVDRLSWEIFGVYGVDSESDYDPSDYLSSLDEYCD